MTEYASGPAAIAVALMLAVVPRAALAEAKGSFKQTCRNINDDGKTVTAECDSGLRNRHIDGSLYITSSLSYAGCADVENIRGRLRCASGRK